MYWGYTCERQTGGEGGWVHRTFRPSCWSDTCERREERRKDWAGRASDCGLSQAAREPQAKIICHRNPVVRNELVLHSYHAPSLTGNSLGRGPKAWRDTTVCLQVHSQNLSTSYFPDSGFSKHPENPESTTATTLVLL